MGRGRAVTQGNSRSFENQGKKFSIKSISCKGYSLEEAIKFPKKEKIKLDLSEDDFIHKMSVQFSVDEGYVWNIMHIKHVPRGLVEQYLIVDRRLTNYKDQLKDLKNKYEETQEKYYSTKSLLFSFVKDK